MRLTPWSMARWSARRLSSSLAPIHIVPPMPQAPNPRADTSHPVRPSRRFSIIFYRSPWLDSAMTRPAARNQTRGVRVAVTAGALRDQNAGRARIVGGHTPCSLGVVRAGSQAEQRDRRREGPGRLAGSGGGRVRRAGPRGRSARVLGAVLARIFLVDQARSSSSRWMSPVTSAFPSPTYMSISLRTPNSGR